jgi:glycosyltransferase involved in cell wall biosynthesis
MTIHRPKILFYSTIPDHLWGGADKYWYEAVLHPQMRDQFDCYAALRDNSATRSYGDRLKALGMSVEFYSEPTSTLLESAWRRVKESVSRSDTSVKPYRYYYPWLVDGIPRLHPDLVWFNVATASHAQSLLPAAAVCRKLNIPYWLIVHHAWEQSFFKDDETTDEFATVVEGAKRVFCVAGRVKFAMERMMGRRSNNMSLTVPALTREFLERARALSSAKPVHLNGTVRFLNLSRFDLAFKGQHILLEVLSDPRWRDRDWSLVLQGGGRLFFLLKRLVDFYGHDPKRVQVREYSEDVHSVIGESDLVVMPSLSEGTPFALSEALASGRPGVGTPVGGIPELLIEGETGWLAHSTEVPDVADALERAWGQRPRWPQVGSNGQKHVAALYDQDRILHELIKALLEDVNRPPVVTSMDS